MGVSREPALPPPPGRAADGGSQGEGSAALLSSPRAVLDVTAAPCRIHEDKSLPPFLCPSASPSVPTLPPSPPAVKAAKEEVLRQSPQPSFIFSSSDIKALHRAECGRWRAALCCGCCRQCRTWHGTARHSTAEHSTARHSTAQQNTARHSTAHSPLCPRVWATSQQPRGQHGVEGLFGGQTEQDGALTPKGVLCSCCSAQ